MKSLKYILFPLLIVIIGTSIYVAVQPNSFDVKRERIIDAPTIVIYNNVIDLKNWEDWSPWLEKNPESNISYSEPTTGVDASFSWADEEGTGNIKTRSTTPNNSIEQDMQFEDYKPSKMNWTFIPTHDGKTKVTWQLKSDHIPFMFKIYSILSGGFDNIFGPDFGRGLEKLDSVVVDQMKAYSVTIHGPTEHGGGLYIYNSASSKIDEFAEKMNDMLSKLTAFATQNNITIAGPAFASFIKWDVKNNSTIFFCCIPTSSSTITTESDILTGQMEPFRAIKTTLNGNYTNSKEAWDKTMAYITDQGYEFTEAGPMLEVYVAGPKNYPNPADWVTEIYIAIKD